jgi:hypothetical protein
MKPPLIWPMETRFIWGATMEVIRWLLLPLTLARTAAPRVATWKRSGPMTGLSRCCARTAPKKWRLEKLADELAAQLGCQDRQQILDTAETTAELANRLRAHDMAECMGCASARMSVATDEQPVNSTSICGQGKVA